MTELTVADFRTIFGLALLLTLFGWLLTGDSGFKSLVTTVGGTIGLLAAFLVVGLLYLHLQRQDAW